MADASTKVVNGASIAYITSGASITAGTIIGATIANALVGTGNLSSYPRCDLVMTYAPASSTSATAMNIPIYRRDINVSNTAYDESAPGASNSNKYVGSFNVPSSVSTGTMYMVATDIPLPGGNSDCEFYIQNNLTNTIPAGWALTVIPKTDVGATT